MKLNKWTVGLAALGVVSLASAVKAEESGNALGTALSSTTFSGYVDTSMQWNFGTGNANNPPYKFGGSSKADGFNLNVIQLTIAKPLDENEWAAGYHADLWFGSDANTLGTQSVLASGSSDIAIRQAYVALRMPIGNGIDWKVGVFDSIIGYESVASPNNPNFTRSYGHSIEPQTHTGVLASYRFNDNVSLSAGVANTVGSSINSRAQSGSSGITGGPLQSVFDTAYEGIDSSDLEEVRGSGSKAESYKTYMGSIALTAPDDWGFLAGSTLYGGVVNGFNGSSAGSGLGGNQTSWYAGATLATPVTGLRFGAAFDYLDLRSSHVVDDESDTDAKLDGWAYSIAGYASYQATEKLSLHLRGEYVKARAKLSGLVADEDVDVSASAKVLALTGTVQYDLWKNVISRLEVRWDHSLDGSRPFGGTSPGLKDSVSNPSGANEKNAVMVAANIIYKF